MREFVNLYLLKAENPEAYKKLASTGMMVGYPASIGGTTHRPDINVGYHTTVKFFDTSKDTPEQIHEIAHKLNMQVPDPKKTGIEPGMFKDRLGNDVYVIKLHGDADKIKEHNAKFSHMGYPATFEYTPHISVDKATWEKIKASGAKTAHEAGIHFGHAELKQGEHTVHTYDHHEKLAASEEAMDTLEKASMKHMAAGLAIASTLAASKPAHMEPIDHAPKAGSHSIEMTNPTMPKYDHKHMLATIAQVESSNGLNTQHEAVGSATAYGKYGLMPNTIHETIKMNHDLKNKYGKAVMLNGPDLRHYMDDNPGLEDVIADKHLSRLEHHFGQNPSELGYAWLNGVTGTYKAKKGKEDIENHWHVRKIKGAYSAKPNPALAAR